MNKVPIIAILLVAIGIGSLVAGLAYTAYSAQGTASYWQGQNQYQQGMMSQWYQRSQTQPGSTLTIDQAKSIAQQYLASTGNANLRIKEIMEFQYNFYVLYSEKDTGIGAFEMLIWKQAPSSEMMGNGMGQWVNGHVALGVLMPEPGPNMAWNTKYGMGYGMMGGGMMGYRNQASQAMTITKEKALQIGQNYLDANLNGAKVEDATQFYGYYTIDYTVNGKIAGMLSVNGFTGEVWYHAWHGAFIQEIQLN
jgi:hypothetical protein